MRAYALLALGTLFVACGSSSHSSAPDAGGTGGTFAPDGGALGADASGGNPDAADASDSASTVDTYVPPNVGPCDNLGAVGAFESITPPLGPSPSGVDGGPFQQTGTFAIAADPVNQGTLYAGTFQQGVWKTTDCGANWTEIATGQNADVVNTGMNWTFAVDPEAPQTVYTNAGYGTKGSGLLKSTNGGVDWDIIWPPAAQPDLSAAFTYNFANVIAMDPSNHLHILLTFHEACLAPHPQPASPKAPTPGTRGA